MDSSEQTAEFILRSATKQVLSALARSPVVVIQGARHIGKTSLTLRLEKRILGKHVLLNDRKVLLDAQTSPLDFVEQHSGGTLIIERVHRCPPLLQAIRVSVERNRQPGRFLLTSSVDLSHLAGTKDVLAGIAETIRLFALSQGELEGVREDFVATVLDGALPSLQGMCRARDEERGDEENTGNPTSGGVAGNVGTAHPPQLNREGYARLILAGGYPEAVFKEPRRRRAYFKSYLFDVFKQGGTGLSRLAHWDKLGKLFSLLAAQASGEYVQARLAADAQIAQTSMPSYIAALKDLCLIHELPAWGQTVSKRAIVRPKLSVQDMGLASYQNRASPKRIADFGEVSTFGALLEGFVIGELFKQQTWSSVDYALYHFRDRDKGAADVIIETSDGRVIGLKILPVRSVFRKDLAGLTYLQGALGDRFVAGIILTTGDNGDARFYGSRIFSAPLSSLWRIP